MKTFTLPGYGRRREGARWVATLVVGAVLGAPAVAEPADEPLTIEDGAKVLVCEKVGFFAIVQDHDGRLSTPQYPQLHVQYADGLFAMTEPDVDIQGVKVAYTSFLKFEGAQHWVFSGLDGTTPFEDRCRDITSDLAFVFPKIAIAATWGLPEIEARVGLFDAIMDDMSTRLELATAERDELAVTNEALQADYESLTLEACEFAAAALPVLKVVHAASATEAASDIDEVLGAATRLGDCLEDSVMVRSSDAEGARFAE
ncbi:hypothetical protein ACRDNQ_08780 [Palleronia sp. KMU-117]|uniref:hypothetical protein n=1 Tax=Palleronia sp. KMU-117 TaxID=3434108 RepID=UPI003D751EE3